MDKRKIRLIAKTLFLVILSIGLFSGCGFQYLISTINSELLAETTTGEYVQDNQDVEYLPRDYIFEGSASELKGRVLVVILFMDDATSKWDFEREELVKERVGIAADFIEDSATEYGQSVEIISDEGNNSDLSYEFGFNGVVSDFDSLDEYYTDPYQEALLDEISDEIPSEQLLRKYNAESIAYLGVVNKDGRSYAYPYEEAYGQDYYNECCCIFFTDESYGEEEPPAVYAHELLHLFSAPDLYEGEDETYNDFTSGQYEYILNNYSNELMNTTYDENGYSVQGSVSNEISEITAYYIGWSDLIPKGFLDAAEY